MKHNPESGNSLFYILIAVALLAALSYAVSESGRSSGKQISDERAKLAASEILEYGHVLSSSVSQLRLRGCSDVELNFDNNTVTGYANAAAPADGTCDIFNINGGGIQWKNPAPEWLDTAIADTEDDYGETLYTGKTCIDEIGSGTADCNTDGSGAAELILVIPFLHEEICIQINNKLGVGIKDAAPPQDAGAAWAAGGRKFTGASTYLGATRIRDAGLTLNGQHAACFQADTYPVAGYHFYKVLNVR